LRQAERRKNARQCTAHGSSGCYVEIRCEFPKEVFLQIILRDLNKADIDEYFFMKHPDQKHYDFNGPYFRKPSVEEIQTLIDSLRKKINANDFPIMKNRRLISNEQKELLGEVNWYWKSKETNWMEIGVIIFEEQNWGKGIGFQALRKWIDLLFADFPEIVRIGLSTWSGNIGMIKLSQKLGMIEEACYRKARIVNDTYYDSISYGILKEEWENIQWQN
jgi:RimJ/RimL family protein N-acetyltransferase